MTVGEILHEIGQGVVTNVIPHAWDIIVYISPIFLAVILFVIAWDLWVDYVRGRQFLGLKYTVLELRLPKETYKSPAAMETFLHALHNTADGNNISQFWKGETRPWYSLEIVSIGGQVKFMIWTEDRRKQGVIGALYSQFPGIEVYEREDYTKGVNFDPKKLRVHCIEFIKQAKFPKEVAAMGFDPLMSALPIKTYIDYSLEKDPKEEFKVDPLTHLIEFMGTINPNQQVWVQIIVRAHRDKQHKPGTLFGTYDAWKESAKALVNVILMRDPKTKVAGMKDEETGFTKLPSISPGETDVVKDIERAITKLPFDVGIRTIYMSPPESFDTPFGVGGLISGFKQFNSESLNGFKGNGDKWHHSLAGLPWEDYRKMRRNRYSRLAMMAYKRRSFFYTPFESPSMVLNTEELATIYHFPGSVSPTPGLSRIPSKKGTAPINLPI